MYIHTSSNVSNQQTGGSLIVETTTNKFSGSFLPVPDVNIVVSKIAENGEAIIIAELTTNSVGQTPLIVLDAPIVSESENVDFNGIPYSTYRIQAKSPSYIPVVIDGVQIFSDVKTIQPITLIPNSVVADDPFSFDVDTSRQLDDLITIGASTLCADYAPKIPEREIKDTTETGFVVLNEVVIPEFIIVHDGSPNNNNAPNYTLTFRDYIKNVASSEIYPTWPVQTIKANVVAIISFTLNRVYTEWYRNQGKPFTITSSTAYDHAFFYGRNIFDTISRVVDELFDTYVKLPGVKQPLFTQYCDGRKVQCPGWMTQWGSQKLGEDGLGYMQILRYFYGENLEFASAKIVYGNPESYPGYALRQGYEGASVRKIQEQLNRISNTYPLIPKIPSDGIFGPSTVDAVKIFQEVFHLTPDGVVGKSTWYKISQVYVAVTKIAALN